MTRPLGPLLIHDRKEFVPEWCPWRSFTEASWHGDTQAQQRLLETKVWTGSQDAPQIVTSNGVEVTVAHVLPERRFAIELDGHLKDKHQFHREVEIKWIETFALAGEKQSGDPSVIPKPSIVDFVKWTEDPRDRSKRIRIGFDPQAPPPKIAKPRTAADAEADPVAVPGPGLQHKPEGVFTQPQTMEAKLENLERVHRGGGISDDEFRAAMRGIAEEAGWASSPSAGGSSETVAPDRASPSSDPASSASDLGESVMSMCGRPWKNERARRMHARRCRECSGLDS
jgi:hypothetical protein